MQHAKSIANAEGFIAKCTVFIKEVWYAMFSIRIDSDQIYEYVFREFATRHFIEDLLTF